MLGLSVTSCSPDEFDMPENNVAAGDLVEGIAYTVTHDSNNPNIVYLDSKMPQGYTVYWEHPQGRCQDNHVELRLPFEGEYTVKFGVETRGGLVFGEPTTFTINDFCAEFVTDELWTYLTVNLKFGSTTTANMDSLPEKFHMGRLMIILILDGRHLLQTGIREWVIVRMQICGTVR
mgnify:CR=1 FL=1